MEVNTLNDRSPFYRLWIFFGIVFLCLFLFSFIGAILSSVLFGLNVLENPQVFSMISDPQVLRALKVMQLVNSIGTFIIPPIVFCYLLKKRAVEHLKLSHKAEISDLMLAAVIMILALPLINYLLTLNHAIHLPEFMSGIELWMRETEQRSEKIIKAFLVMESPVDLIFTVVLIALIPAIGEELLFRGVVQTLLKERFTNIHISVWLAAFLFSFLHFQFLGFIPRLLLGAVLGYLFAWSGSLWVPITAHFTNNGLAVLSQYLIQRNIISPEIEEFGADSNLWHMALLSLVFVSLLLWHLQRKHAKKFFIDIE